MSVCSKVKSLKVRKLNVSYLITFTLLYFVLRRACFAGSADLTARIGGGVGSHGSALFVLVLVRMAMPVWVVVLFMVVIMIGMGRGLSIGFG